MTVALYISGHGYGHATRLMEVARQLLRLRPEVRYVVRSSIPPWIVRLNLDGYAEFFPRELDTGVRQTDSYHPDKLGTLLSAAELWNASEVLATEEVDFLRSRGVRLILADLPALAFEISHRAKIPAVGMGNFSWDWIYEPYAEEFPEYRWVLERIRQAYSLCPLLLRLPFHGEMDAFPVVQDIPLVARHAEKDPQEVRTAIGLADEGRPVILIALRGEDLASVRWTQVGNTCGAYRFVSFQDIPLGGVLRLPPDLMRFQELVRAADVVVSKPGYGIVSECIANRTPLLYTERFEFREYRILAKALEEYGWSLCIPHDEFTAGNWLPYLERIRERLSRPPRPYRTDGATVAASVISDRLG